MSVGKGDLIGGYRLEADFNPGNNCRHAPAEKGGIRYFVKEFKSPKYPPDALIGEVRARKLERCASFEARQSRLVNTLAEICAKGGNIVMPEDFIRVGNIYYHIAPFVAQASLKPTDIALAPRKEKLILLRLLARSLVTLQSRGIVHGDLKPDNILITRTSAGLLAPKIIDFDGAYFATEPPADHDDLDFDPTYMSPELLVYTRRLEKDEARARKSMTCASDIFTFGLLMHEYWTGRLPGSDCAAVVLGGGELPLTPGDMPAVLVDVLRACLKRDSGERPLIGAVDNAIGEAVAGREAIAKEAVRDSGSKLEVRIGRRGERPGPSYPLPRPIAPLRAAEHSSDFDPVKRERESSDRVSVRLPKPRPRDGG